MQLAIEHIDARQHRLRELDRGYLARLNQVRNLCELEVVQFSVVHGNVHL